MLILFLLLGYALIFIVYVVIRLSLYRDIGDYPAAAIDKSILLTTIIRPSTRPSSSGARTPPSSGPQPGHHHSALVRHHRSALVRHHHLSVDLYVGEISLPATSTRNVLLSNRGGTPRLSRGVLKVTDLAS